MPGKQNRVAVMSVLTLLLALAGFSRRSWEQPPFPISACPDGLCLKGEDHPISTIPKEADYAVVHVPWNIPQNMIVWRDKQALNSRSPHIDVSVYEMPAAGMALSKSAARSAARYRPSVSTQATPVLQAGNTVQLSCASLGLTARPQHIAFDLKAEAQKFTLNFLPSVGTHAYLVVVSGTNANNTNVQTSRLFIVNR